MHQEPLRVVSWTVNGDGWVTSVRVRAGDEMFYLINGSSREGVQLPLNIGFMKRRSNDDT